MSKKMTNRSFASSCWIVVDNKVYDIASYLYEHPTGNAAIIKNGRDLTSEFRKIGSAPDMLQFLPKDACLGTLDATAQAALIRSLSSPDSTNGDTGAKKQAPHISSIIISHDFETVARAVMRPRQWTFISSSAHNTSALQGNYLSWQAIRFRPRVLRNVQTVNPQSSILGSASAFPFFVSPMGQWGRGHQFGEAGAVRALARRGVHCVLSAESMAKMEYIAAAFADEKLKIAEELSNSSGGKPEKVRPEAQLHFQLYVSSDLTVALKRTRRARATGIFRSLWVTVDAPILGKRTADRRLLAAETLAKSPELAEDAGRGGVGLVPHANGSTFNASLTWDDLKWIKSEWDGPVVLKGVQTAEDAAHAADLGIDGVLLSNHGGRQMHDAVDALTTLLEIRTHYPVLLDKLEIFVDGGCRDGADVLKAVCLGAKAVGIGRPFFYAFGTYGEKGVERCVDILADELITAMKLLGISTIDEARPEFVNASRLLGGIWRPEKSHL